MVNHAVGGAEAKHLAGLSLYTDGKHLLGVRSRASTTELLYVDPPTQTTFLMRTLNRPCPGRALFDNEYDGSMYCIDLAKQRFSAYDAQDGSWVAVDQPLNCATTLTAVEVMGDYNQPPDWRLKGVGTTADGDTLVMQELNRRTGTCRTVAKIPVPQDATPLAWFAPYFHGPSFSTLAVVPLAPRVLATVNLSSTPPTVLPLTATETQLADAYGLLAHIY